MAEKSLKTKMAISRTKTKHGVTNTGYRRVYIPGIGRKLEHRVVAEKKLGRHLRRDEIVHHKNGDKLDNSPGNLEVMSRIDHIKEHDVPGFNGLSAKISFKEAEEIRSLYKEGSHTQAKLGQIYGVGQDNISRIVNNIYWSNKKLT